MSAMTLHWSPLSPFVRKVMICAIELGLDDRIDRVRSVANMSVPNPELMRINPLGKIPALVLEDGAVIADSTVICLYLDALAGGGRLLPEAGAGRWTELTRHSMANGLLDALILWRNERAKPADRQTPAWIEGFSLKTAAVLDQFEHGRLARPPGVLALSDAAMGCALSYLDFRFADLDWRDGRPTLADWHAWFTMRDSARRTEILDDR